MSDYKKVDPKWYLQFYTKPFKPTTEMLEKFCDFLKSHKIHGANYLDYGTGASMHTIIPVAKYYDDITITYYTESDGNMAKQWINGDPEAFDWTPWIKFVLEYENPNQTITTHDIEERTNLMRSKVKRILPSDITKDNIVQTGTATATLYDGICSSETLEACCQNYSDYCIAAQKVSNLLAKNGTLFLIGNLQCSFYKFGDQKFTCVPLKADEIENAFKQAGLSNFTWHLIHETFYIDPSDCDMTGSFFMTATK